jgi:hypothetical protein
MSMPRLLTLCALLAAVAPRAAAQEAIHLLVVTGLSGERSFATSFGTSATTLLTAAKNRWKVLPTQAIWLAESVEAGEAREVHGVATRQSIAAAVDSVAARSAEGDVVLVVLIGHGSGEGEESRLSLPGPDPTAADYSRWLDRLAGRRVALVNAASASGDFLPVLSAPGRVVITATRSATERNATTFMRHFSHGIASGEADANRDGQLTLLEAFDYARRAVDEAYTTDGRLLTEHAQLDDDGDGKGTADTSVPEATDGRVAARIVLGARAAPVSPQVAALLAERRALEGEVDALRLVRDRYDAAAYADALEALLVAIAERTQAIRALESGVGGAP